jgi:cell wall-associated NlpC family hydrolase
MTAARGATRLLAGLTLVVTSLAGLPGVAGADAISAKREEARKLQDTIEAQGERLSILVERYNAARLDVDRVTAGVLATRRRLDAAQNDTATIRARVRDRAIALYKGAGVVTPMATLAARDVHEAGLRATYASAIAGRNDHDLGELRRSVEDLTIERRRLETNMASAKAFQTKLDGQRDGVVAAMADQKATLARVQGELTHLVAEEQTRRRAAAAAAARAAMSRRGRPVSRGSINMVNVPAPNARAGTAVDVAKAQIGKPYKWGGAGPDSFDCSGLAMYSWGKAGVSLPHSAAAQYNSLPHVPVDQLVPGDLVFYGSSIHHVGIYIGGGQMVNAPQTGEYVRVDSMYRRDFAGAARPG